MYPVDLLHADLHYWIMAVQVHQSWSYNLFLQNIITVFVQRF